MTSTNRDSTFADPVVLERTDYPSLALDHPDVSVRDLSIVGLDLKVFGLEEIKDSDRPISVLIATHGRMGSMKHLFPFAQGIIGETNRLAAVSGAAGEGRKRDLIVVTLDQRNHGARLVNKQANLAYDENPTHLVDMAATVAGGCQDVTLVINFLAPYLFPNGEKVIEEFVVTGISLGGNVTWRLLREEPRIKIGIPIIGLPFEAFSTYLGARATSMGIPFAPPTYPPSLRPFLEAPVDLASYKGKKILSLHGKEDTLVPLSQGKTRLDKIVDSVNGNDGGKVVVTAQEGVGHACSVEMLKKTAEWVWLYALSDGAAEERSAERESQSNPQATTGASTAVESMLEKLGLSASR